MLKKANTISNSTDIMYSLVPSLSLLKGVEPGTFYHASKINGRANSLALMITASTLYVWYSSSKL